jgi:TolA-binding protein
MAKLTARSGAMFMMLAGLAAAPACAKHHAPTTAERAEIAHGEMTASDSLTATVDAVDPANQAVYLHDDQGRRFAVQADQGAVERLQPQDQIKVVYQESVQFALQEPKQGSTDQKTKVEDLTELQGRDAVQFGRKISTTVQVLSVGEKGSSVEFRGPEGQVRTVAIDDESSREKIAALRPGDKVAVTYVEKLALKLDEAHGGERIQRGIEEGERATPDTAR